MLILKGNSIEHLYVDPDWFAQGLGFALLEWAKSGHPETLELWTFESNIGAQRFYERHAFGAVGRTTGDSEEGAPVSHTSLWRSHDWGRSSPPSDTTRVAPVTVGL